MKRWLLGTAVLAALVTGACRSENDPPSVTGATPRAGTELKLSEGGKTAYTIVYDFGANDVLVDPAVRDLAATLKEITGAEFAVKPAAEGPKIVIGKAALGDKAEFRSRERRIRSVGKDLYLYGGDRYGTAGAIYNFLREFCGCRWYTATGDKRIPKNPNLAFAAIRYSRVPSFKSLEHGGKWISAARNPDIRDWVRRNNSFLMPDYAFGEADDAWFYIGPVTHTLSAYMPPIIRKPRSFNADNTFQASICGKQMSGTYTFDPATSKVTLQTLLLNINCYAKKNVGGIALLFEASKLLTMLQTVAALSGNTTITTIGDLSKNYDGVRLGFDFK